MATHFNFLKSIKKATRHYKGQILSVNNKGVSLFFSKTTLRNVCDDVCLMFRNSGFSRLLCKKLLDLGTTGEILIINNFKKMKEKNKNNNKELKNFNKLLNLIFCCTF